jgi:hypothetical protein
MSRAGSVAPGLFNSMSVNCLSVVVVVRTLQSMINLLLVSSIDSGSAGILGRLLS